MKMNIKNINQSFQVIFTTLIIIFLPLVVFTLITSKVSVSGIQSFVVLTGSMQPYIPQGSIIFTRQSANYLPKDVIAFKQGNIIVTHRVISLVQQNGQTLYQTQGDANNTPDTTLVDKSSILGKKMLFVPYVGKFILSLKTLPGFVAFIILPILAFIGSELWNIKKEIEKSVEKKLVLRLGVNTDDNG